jgi:ParB family chromosome partitioning protein
MTTTTTPETVQPPTPVEEPKVKSDITRTNMFLVPPEDFIIIGLDTKDGPEHPLYDPRILMPVDKYMVANVQEYGVKEAVLYTKTDKTYPGKMVITAGRKRIIWARTANENLRKAGQAPMKVRAILEHGDESELVAISILENECRVNDDMLAKARKAYRLVNTYGYNQSEAAKVFGVHPTSLRIWLKLVALSPEVQAAVEKKQITSSAALQLGKLPIDKQAEALAGLIAAAEVEEKEERDGVRMRPAGEPEGGEDGEKKPAKLKDRKTGKIKITAAKVAGAAAGKGAAPKAQDKAQEGIAPKRAQVRRALKYLLEKKGTYARTWRTSRTMGATLAWVLGDLDTKKTELEELAADTQELIREVFKASAKKKVIKVATKE